MNDWLKFEKKDSIATLTMNRPDIRNPLGEPEDVINFEEASDLINNDRDIRCVILTGAGKAFSAGGNVKNMQNKSGNFSGSSVALRERYRFGIHKIIFYKGTNRIEFKHESKSRNIYSDGALQAAHWIKGKKKGLYSFEDFMKSSNSL